MRDIEAALAAQAQHAMLGIKEDKSNYKRTTHPDAQWFGSAGLGLTPQEEVGSAGRHAVTE